VWSLGVVVYRLHGSIMTRVSHNVAKISGFSSASLTAALESLNFAARGIDLKKSKYLTSPLVKSCSPLANRAV
jgi:hypothetical protein